MSPSISSLDFINTDSMVIHNKKNLVNNFMTNTSDTITNDAPELPGLDEVAVVVLVMVAMVVFYSIVIAIGVYCIEKRSEESLRNSPQGRPLSYADLYPLSLRTSPRETTPLLCDKPPSYAELSPSPPAYEELILGAGRDGRK